MTEITEANGLAIISLFRDDLKKYLVIPIVVSILERAEALFAKYGKDGLRTLDSIQLASALSINHQIQLFKSADKLLNDFFKLEAVVGQ
jgi:uncharacterized protein